MSPISTTMTHGVQVTLEDVYKDFGAQRVLRGITLQVAVGEFIAFVGKSGCGKSTLLRLIARLDTPTRGMIEVVDTLAPDMAPTVRFMFQDARLLPWKSVQNNVSLGLPRKDHGRAAEALEQVGLKHRGRDWPATLSGGQRQRVALARALASGPNLLLLDEPLGALDALTRLEMQQLLEALWQEQQFTALLVTHDVEEAVALADRVILIEEGQFAEEYLIALPRPRDRESREFAAIKAHILQRIMTPRPFAQAMPVTYAMR